MKNRLMTIIAILIAGLLFGCAGDADDENSKDSAVDAAQTEDDDEAGDDDQSGLASDDDGKSRACEAVAPEAWPAADFADPSVIAFDDEMFFTVDGQRFSPWVFITCPEMPNLWKRSKARASTSR